MSQSARPTTVGEQTTTPAGLCFPRQATPIVVGSLIAAGGLVLGGLVGGVNGSARSGNAPVTAKHHGEPANITLVKADIKAYYGRCLRTARPSSTPARSSTCRCRTVPYAKDVGALIRKAKAYMTKRLQSWPRTSPASEIVAWILSSPTSLMG